MKALFFAFLLLSLPVHAASTSLVYSQAKQLVDAKDFLGFRIFMKEAYAKKITQGEWFALKNLIAFHGDQSGYDLIPFWNARNSKGASALDRQLFQVDLLMKQSHPEQAFNLAQNAAEQIFNLKSARIDAALQLPFIYHSMGRALYASKRYDEAIKVYQWISPNYPYFAQVLFEKMWAAFKAGRVDLALGAIASQRSVYFATYLAPESYLIQSYLYRRLCRDEDQKQVIEEMKRYEAELSKPDSLLPLVTDVNTRVLAQLADAPNLPSDKLNLVGMAARERERMALKTGLRKRVDASRAKILKDLKTVIAYQQLSSQDEARTALKPIEAMKSRDDLLKQNLEVWPADSAEEWIDELGKHVLIGESLCKSAK